MLTISGAMLVAYLSCQPVAPPKVERVGAFVLQGNVNTRSRAILNVVHRGGFECGQRMPSEADRLKVEIALLMRFHDRFDLDAGDRPTLVLDRTPDSEFIDIIIRFPERDKK